MCDERAAFPDFAIETERLALRALRGTHAAAMAELANDPDVALMTGRIPYPYGLADATAFIQLAADGWLSGTEIALAVERRADEVFLGCVSLSFHGPVAELGYWIGRPFWRQGFATEAARALVDYAFETMTVETVTAACRVINESSRRVIEKCGLRYVTSGLAAAPARGGALPVDRFRLTRRDWSSFKAWRPAVLRAAMGERADACG
jgi:RimJ/RimL family protein N-acetyltransferase